MKNMGLTQLVLVRPRQFPDPEASARASGADSVLASARVTDSLAQALEGCGFVAATTARERDQNFRVLEVRAAAARIVQEARRAPVAVLFGAERTGLPNEALEPAHLLIRIPASAEYASLNLAMAVQLVAYEIYRASRGGEDPQPAAPERAVPLAGARQMQQLYEHLGEVMQQVEFRDRTQSGTNLMSRIRRFLQRAELDENEANILRGLLTAVQGRRRRAGAGAVPPDSARPRGVIYLDNAATTAVDPAVARLMSEYLGDARLQANPSSAHAPGRAAAVRIERAREQVAQLIGARAHEIVLTSGATESDNLAVLGLARANADRGRHVVTARTEHRALLAPCRRLAQEGFEISYLTPDRSGRIDPASLKAALRPDTVLVSIMHVNNETGVIQDIAAMGAICRARGIPFHTDAAQSAGKLPLDVTQLPLDLMSFTAHKIHGPKGIGALYVRDGARALLEPVSFGAEQEGGLRPGTLATHQIVGFGAAAALARERRSAEQERFARLAQRLWRGLESAGGVYLNGADAPRAPHILNASFEDVDGESLIARLGPLAVSTGAACSSASGEPSYVLRALGRSPRLAESSLRFSFGRFSTEGEVDRAVEIVRAAVEALRAVSPRGSAARVRLESSAPASIDQLRAAADARGANFAAAGLSVEAERLFAELPRSGDLADAAGTVARGEAGGEREECWVRFSLLVNGDTVKDARFLALGCPHTLAVAAWLAGQLPGRTRREAIPGDPLGWAQALGVPVEKLGRLLVVEDALRSALGAWPASGLENS